ncbi:hypothetical protein DFH06DRAFT_1163880 [Mycena polygramma]|nr:hypothetical protein DFH06DRAFT_1163880 [Mycena polygramma]
MSHASPNDANGGVNGGILPPQPSPTPQRPSPTPQRPTPTPQRPSPSPQFSPFPSPSSSAAVSSTSSVSTASPTTATGLLSATTSPQVSAQSAASSSRNTNLGLIIGASVGGMVLGALAVFFFFYWRRRQALRRARRSVGIEPYTHIPDEEKRGPLEIPFTAPGIPTTPNAKIMDWMRRNRIVSVSSISTFSSPTIIESAGDRTSLSAYSQASVLASGTSGELVSKPDGIGKRDEAGITQPPGLYPINE